MNRKEKDKAEKGNILILGLVFMAVVMYGIVAFLLGKTDPMEWHIIARIGVIVSYILFTIAYLRGNIKT